jgi:hypothetical protein
MKFLKDLYTKIGILNILVGVVCQMIAAKFLQGFFKTSGNIVQKIIHRALFKLFFV